VIANLLTDLGVTLLACAVVATALVWAAHATFGDFRRGGRR
jgi:hypothetical protein